MHSEANMIAYGEPINGGLECGPIHDVYDDDMNFPDGQCQYPEAEHSLKMAGKQLGMNVGGLGDYI